MRKILPRALVFAGAVAGAALALVALDGAGDLGRQQPQAKPLVDPNEAAKAPRRPNVLLLLLDEFNIDSILGPDGRIDAVRYPNFAALAANSTWFPNAWAAYDSTPKAIPLILDGRKPRKGLEPDVRGHPRTIFDALGGRGYRIISSEEATAVCRRRWCPREPARRPGILGNLNRGRLERVERFFARITPSRRPTLWMKHALLPHGPYAFLPSGMRARTGPRDPIPGMNSPQGFHDPFLTQHNEQRYLLQIGFVDHELGKLFRRMVANGTFDQTLILITADHGIDWTPGVRDRRKVNQRNVEQITPVPFFLKAPGQRRGRIDRSLVSTLDVTPTIADVLNIRLPYRASGHSAFSRTVRRRGQVRLPTRDFSRIVRISGKRWRQRRRGYVRGRLGRFGFGVSGLFNRIGPARELVGRPLASLRVRGKGRVGATLAFSRGFRSVRRSTGVVPTQVAGDIKGARRGEKRSIAVAVNGRIEAVGRSFYLHGDRTEHFAVMVPEEAMREGRNGVEVFEVLRGGALRRLAAL